MVIMLLATTIQNRKIQEKKKKKVQVFNVDLCACMYESKLLLYARSNI